MKDWIYLEKILFFKSRGIVAEISGELKIYKSAFHSLEIILKHFSNCNDSFSRIYVDTRLIDIVYRDICNSEYMTINYHMKADFIMIKERELTKWVDNYVEKLKDKWKNNSISKDEAKETLINFLNILVPENKIYTDDDNMTKIFYHNTINLIKKVLNNSISFEIRVENL